MRKALTERKISLRAFARAILGDTFPFLVVAYQVLFKSQQEFRGDLGKILHAPLVPAEGRARRDMVRDFEIFSKICSHWIVFSP